LYALAVLPFAALVLILLLHNAAMSNDQRHQVQFGSVANSSAKRVVLTVQSDRLGREFVPGAVGLSIETRELATADLSVSDKSLVAMMRLLGPGILRIGGISLDDSWWTSDGEPPPAWADSTITPADLDRLGRLLTATGWKAILGVDLGHYDPDRAANEAQVAAHVLGAHVLGFEVGNEPRDYGTPQVGLRSESYTADDYLEELAAYHKAMQASVPTTSLYGPDLGRLTPRTWLGPIASTRPMPFSSIDLHYYPTHYSVSRGACEGTPTPTGAELLSPRIRERENAVLTVMLEAGTLAQRSVRISETNDTSSCDVPGGPDTSPVFASALWSLDWALRASSAGIAGVNFHGYFGLCLPESFAPICEPSKRAAAARRAAARPEYYGLLAARQLEGGQFVSTKLTSPWRLPNLTSWATVTSSGTLKIAIENFATGDSGKAVSISVPGYSGRYETLTGPSVEATNGVAFGDAAVTRTGRWQPRATGLPCSSQSCSVVVRPSSAVIVTMEQTSSARGKT
jgi:hypothetical protein